MIAGFGKRLRMFCSNCGSFRAFETFGRNTGRNTSFVMRRFVIDSWVRPGPVFSPAAFSVVSFGFWIWWF